MGQIGEFVIIITETSRELITNRQAKTMAVYRFAKAYWFLKNPQHANKSQICRLGLKELQRKTGFCPKTQFF